MRTMSLVAVLSIAAVARAGAPDVERLKIVVPGVYPHAGVEQGSADVLTDLLLEALLTRHGVRALGPPDVRTILSAEQQRVLLGCQDEACFADLAGALGADWLVAGSLGKLGELWVLSLQLIDPRQARVTARTSATLKSLEQAPDVIGPLVDKLLGQQPRVRTPAALADGGERPARKAWSVKDHCKRMQAYFTRLEARAYGSDLLAARRDMLEDLVLTPFFQQFDHKTNCFWEFSPGPVSRLRTAWLKARSRLQADDLQRRYREVAVFQSQIKLLEEAVPRQLEMEKLGTGRRLSEVPFSVEATQVPRPDPSPAVKAYLDAFPAASKVVLQALAATDQASLQAVFAASVEARHVASAFKELAAWRKQGFDLDACPVYLLDPEEIEENARLLAERKRFKTCLRRSRGDFASREFLQLERVGDGWKVISW